MSKYDDFDNNEHEDEDINDGSGHQEYLEERQRALDEFADRLANDPTSLNYTEEDWVMLAAYASDVDNFYLLSEAVTRGLIEYPDSPDLNDRRLLMMVDTCNPTELRQVFDAAVARPNPSKIARMYKAFYDWQDAMIEKAPAEDIYRTIKEIAIDEDHLTDQEIIEAVGLIREADKLALLFDDIDTWAKHSFYVDTLWYEVAGNASESGQYEIAVAATQKLTELAPYNDVYWMHHAGTLLMHAADEQRGLNRDLVVQAHDAFETALAINPDNPDADKFRNKIMTAFAAMGEIVGADEDQSEKEVAAKMTPELFLGLTANFNAQAKKILTEWVKQRCSNYFAVDPNPYLHANDLLSNLAALYVAENYDVMDYLLALTGREILNTEFFTAIYPLLALRLLDKNEPNQALKLLECLDDDMTEPVMSHLIMKYEAYKMLKQDEKALEIKTLIQRNGLIYYTAPDADIDVYISPALIAHLMK